MCSNAEVDPRIHERHPELLDSDILSAWKNAFVIIERSGVTLPDTILVAVGSDSNNRLIEMVGALTENDKVHLFHAMTPPSAKTLAEVGIE